MPAENPSIDPRDFNRVLKERDAAEYLALSKRQLQILNARLDGPIRVRLSQRRVGYRLGDLVGMARRTSRDRVRWSRNRTAKTLPVVDSCGRGAGQAPWHVGPHRTIMTMPSEPTEHPRPRASMKPKIEAPAVHRHQTGGKPSPFQRSIKRRSGAMKIGANRRELNNGLRDRDHRESERPESPLPSRSPVTNSGPDGDPRNLSHGSKRFPRSPQAQAQGDPNALLDDLAQPGLREVAPPREKRVLAPYGDAPGWTGPRSIRIELSGSDTAEAWGVRVTSRDPEYHLARKLVAMGVPDLPVTSYQVNVPCMRWPSLSRMARWRIKELRAKGPPRLVRFSQSTDGKALSVSASHIVDAPSSRESCYAIRAGLVRRDRVPPTSQTNNEGN